jgi:diacylglycerol kinase (ATP)
MPKIAVIVNPKSGMSRTKDRAAQIASLMPEGLEYDLLILQNKEPQQDLFKRILSGAYNKVAVAGGDGTVNAAATALSGTGVPLAIIPFGSGNGLARHLGIPLDIRKALLLLSEGREKSIDTCHINSKAFFTTAGVGFDAHIGKLFSESPSRGFRTYARITLSQLLAFRPDRYTLEVDGIRSEHEAFLITFANAAQYGSNAYIAPLADISDGLIDISIIRPFPLLKGVPLAYRLFSKTLQHSKEVQMLKGKHIILERSGNGPVQYDGESDMMGPRLEIRIVPRSLQVLV